MQTFEQIDNLVCRLSQEEDIWMSLAIAIDLADEIMKNILPLQSDWHEQLTRNSQKTGNLPKPLPQDIYKNNKQHSWFHEHPTSKTAKVALKHFEADDCDLESNFYWFNEKETKQKISTAVHFTTNWEDGELYEQPSNKVSINFILSHDTKKLMMVISKEQNLRVLELSEQLSNTQKEIFNDRLFHVFDGVNETGNQGIIHSRLWEALQLNEVNNKFYQGIVKYFHQISEDLIKKNGKNKNEAKQFSSRLLGRLIFIWFLRKMEIIDESFGYFKTNEKATIYYNKTLKNLFFNTLNTPINKRPHNDILTPYLNGGLFEEKKGDFNDENIEIRDEFFRDLFEHFDSFNFTTDESSPEFQIVAVDPEMLGQIFESLLSQELDDQDLINERSRTGAFYTPKTIVNFMSRESIRQYLYRQLDNQSYHKGIDILIDYSDAEYMAAKSTGNNEFLWGVNTSSVLPKVIDALKNVKIIDPAVGSGAYPIGMMQVLTKLFERLLPANKFNAYEIKLHIIENNIYGVDLNPMATEIARLRAWLSLIVEDLKTKSVEPLPNLDFKFISADSLIPLDNEISFFSDTDLDVHMTEIRKKYFNARLPHTKQKWQDRYFELTNDISLFDDKRTKQLKSFNPFDNSSVAEFYDSQFMFGIENGFDICIGNPPYIHFEKMEENQRNFYKELGKSFYETYAARGDIYTLFYEHGMNILKDGGILSYITSNKWMRAGYGKKLRDYLVTNTNPIALIDLGGGVFSSATVDTNIFIAAKETNIKNLKAITLDEFDDLNNEIKKKSTNLSFKVGEPWTILTPIELSIKEKIENVGTPLKDWDIDIYRGILTGLNEAFIISEEKKDELIAQDPNSAEIIRPILRGRDINKYSYSDSGLFLINSHNGYTNSANEYIPRVKIENYPAIKKHFDKFFPKLDSRTDQGDTPYNLRSTDYMEDFLEPKILFSRIAANAPRFAYDDSGYFLNDTAYFIVGNDLKYLLEQITSDLFWFALNKFYKGGGIGSEFKIENLKNLPIPLKNKPLPQLSLEERNRIKAFSNKAYANNN